MRRSIRSGTAGRKLRDVPPMCMPSGIALYAEPPLTKPTLTTAESAAPSSIAVYPSLDFERALKADLASRVPAGAPLAADRRNPRLGKSPIGAASAANLQQNLYLWLRYHSEFSAPLPTTPLWKGRVHAWLVGASATRRSMQCESGNFLIVMIARQCRETMAADVVYCYGRSASQG